MGFFGGSSISETITGTAGDDIITGQGGADTLIGGDGNDDIASGEYITTTVAQFDYMGDRLEGGNGNDTLTGGSGSDILVGGAGSNALHGGSGGYDTAVYAGARADYTVAMSNGVPVNVQSTTAGGERDSLQSVERIAFSDGAWAYDIAGNAGHMYRLYQAAFDRAPDSEGLGYWMKVMDNGATGVQIAEGFLGEDEFSSVYGNNVTDEVFLTKLYENVLGREYDQGGYDFWLADLKDGDISRAAVLDHFAESPENQAAVIGAIQNGIEYTPYG